MVERIERFIFAFRLPILIGLMIFTVIMGLMASQLRMDAGFEKQLPLSHPYIKTFLEYRESLSGANRVIVVVSAKEGEIWNQAALARLKDVTDAIFFLPGVDRRTVTSLWTPNTRFLETTEEGLTAGDVIPGTVTVGNMTEEDVVKIRSNVIAGGYVGRLVANDSSAAMILAELLDTNPDTGERLDYFDLADQLEVKIREQFQDEQFDIHIVGFAKLVGDIADGARSVVKFFLIAFLLTALSVYYYSRSIILTFLPMFASLTSLIWQFGILSVLGFGLDPLAVLVPFLVFAIGVSHGVQQINLISSEICNGASPMEAARASFRRLLVPGSMALVTDLVGFGTLYFISIGMIKELAITASIGVALKIITNLMMLPLLVSYARFDDGYKDRITKAIASRVRPMAFLGQIANPRPAMITAVLCAVLFVLAFWQSQGRHVGDLFPGAPELHADARYNLDSVFITEKFSIGLDLLTVIIETPEQACIEYKHMKYLNEFSWHMTNAPGVQSVISLPFIAKRINSGWNEGALKFKALPRNQFSLVQATSPVPSSSGLVDPDCTVLPQFVFLADHKATTIKSVIASIDEWEATDPNDEINIRLGSGNVGIMAATNQEIEESEMPMMMLVYAVIILMVLVTYRDWRAAICCCAPLTLATFLGYWFMKEFGIGLKVATLPVMVLAVGLGVDYAFYIYSRLQVHLAEGLEVAESYQKTLLETGNAVVFTAVTLAIGVSTWAFSDLKFQADMGVLLTFMFLINMIMAVTALPALAVILDKLVPRKGPIKVSKYAH